MTGSVAFFLSPEGDLVDVPLNHIATVIAEPDRFGLTPAEIEAAFLRHGERIGVEGEARKELLLRLINQGWIRIRRYRNYWSVTSHHLPRHARRLLRIWARRMLSGTNGFRETDRYTPVRISTSEGETILEIGTLADGSCRE